MTILYSALAAVAVALVVYAVWPRNRAYSYTIENDHSAVQAFYTRAARGWFEKWNQRWEYTGGRARHPKLIGSIMAGVGIGSLLLVGVITKNPLLTILIPALLVGGPWGLLGTQSRKREEVITSQLVDFLDAVRSNLETDTPELAIRSAAASAPAPLNHELAQLVSDLDSRVNLSAALQNLANRNASRSMAFACATLDMAKQTGSQEIVTNLTELAKLIRNNERTAGDIRNKTLILRVSAKMFLVVPLLTVGFSMLSFGIEPWNSTLGYISLAIIIGVAVGAWFGFRKLQQWQVGV